MRKLSQPIIALIQGPAVGGGFTFTMAADIRIASKNAKFNVGAINLAMSGGDLAGSYFLPRLIGISRAIEIMYTGRFVNAEEAEKIGYVLKIVEEDKLLDAGLELAGEMINKSPLGLRMTKEAINLSLNSPSLETIIHLDNRAQIIGGATKDMFKALQSFMEKRKPNFPLK